MSFGKIKIIPFHPFLFGIYPLLFFYSRNEWLFSVKDFLATTAIFIIAIFILLFALRLLLKDLDKAGLVISFTFLALFSIAPIATKLKEWFGDYVQLRYILTLWCFFFLLGNFVILRFIKNGKRFSPILNIVAVFLVLIPLFGVGSYVYNMNPYGILTTEDMGRLNPGSTGKQKPDIYYIVLDAYADRKTLERQWGLDNGSFYDFLSGKGFTTVSESRANYGMTTLSLASSLNMRYLDENDGVSEYKVGHNRLVSLVAENEVMRFLKKEGYATAYIGSGFFVENLPKADVVLFWDASQMFPLKNPLLMYFLKSSLPSQVVRFLPKSVAGDGRGVLWEFDRLGALSAMSREKPMFLFAHILAPHPDYTLDENCRVIAPEENAKRGYAGKLLCVNSKIKEFIEPALSSSGSPPIIILQSDHGLSSSDVDVSKFGVSVDAARGKVGNFISIYLPDGTDKIFPYDLTPVNLFRLIFNYYFDAGYELLENKSYFVCETGCPDAEGERKALFDVTEEVKF